MIARFYPKHNILIKNIDLSKVVTIKSADNTTPFNLQIDTSLYSNTMYYSLDGVNWDDCKNLSKNVTSTQYYFLGYGNVSCGSSSGNRPLFSSNTTTKYTVSGKLASLLSYNTSILNNDSLILMDDYAFCNCFKNNTYLTDVSGLVFPTKTSDHCYENMFAGCTMLVTSPTLPATTLSDYCYHNMFNGCTMLPASPELPATNLAVHCYDSMFYNCTSVIELPVLPATTLASGCYASMFYNCDDIVINSEAVTGVAKEIIFNNDNPNVTNTDAFNNMFAGTNGTFTGAPEFGRSYYTRGGIVTEKGYVLYRCYRSGSNVSTIVRYIDAWGNEAKMEVADAKYRAGNTTFQVSCQENADIPNFDGSVPGIPELNARGNWYLDGVKDFGSYGKSPLPTEVTNEQISEIWGYIYKYDNTAKYNCDTWYPKVGAGEAVNYVRSLTIGGGTPWGDTAWNIPTAYQLLILFLLSDEIDALDPTGKDYPELMLGKDSKYGRFMFTNAYHSDSAGGYNSTAAWSCTDYNYAVVRFTDFNGSDYMYSWKARYFAAIPIREIPN